MPRTISFAPADSERIVRNGNKRFSAVWREQIDVREDGAE